VTDVPLRHKQDRRHSLLRVTEEEHPDTGVTGTAAGEGYPPLAPPPLCKTVSPVVEVHDGSTYKDLYLFTHFSNIYVSSS